MTNRVDIEVTGTNKFDATQAAVVKQMKELQAQAAKTTVATKKLDDQLDAKPKMDGVKEAEKAIKKLADTADDAFDKVKTKMEDAFKDADSKAKITLKVDVDKERLKSSVADGLGGLDFFGGKDIVKGGIGGKLLEGLLKGVNFAEAGAKGAANFVGGIADGVKNGHPAITAAIYTTITAAALTVGPFVGAALGGALVAGFGAAIGGIGIMAAAQNDEVASNYRILWDDIVEDVKKRAVVYEQVLIRTAQRAKTIWNESGNEVERAFDKVAPGVERMLDGILRSIQSVVDHFDPIVDAANAVFSDLGARLPGIIDEIMDDFAELADIVAGSPEAFGDFIAVLGEVVEVALDLTSALAYMYGGVRDLFEVLGDAAPWNIFDDGAEAAGKMGTKMAALSDIGEDTTSKLDGIQAAFKDLAEAEDDAAKRGDAFLEILNKLNGIAPSFDDAMKDANDTIRSLLENFSGAVKESDGFGKSLLNADGTINTMTKNGSALYDAMSDLRGNFADMAGATKELEQAGLSHEAAVAKVNAAVSEQATRLVQSAEKMGLNQDQMRELLRLYGLTPKQIDTLLKLDDKDFRDRVAYDLLPAVKPITVVYNHIGSPMSQGSGRTYGVTDYAQGGPVAKAASAGVRSGEVVINDGPGYPGEAVKLPNGSVVMPAGNTALMARQMAQGGGNGGVTLKLMAGAANGLEALFIEWLKQAIRENGGDASVLGGG